MKRTRVSLKKYVESSESEDDIPLKKSSPDVEKNDTNHGDSSSSESDIENYLHKPEKLDLNSEFFNTKSANLIEFENIEKNIFAGVSRLSDSESDSDKEAEPCSEKISPKRHAEKSSVQEKHEHISSSSRLSFNQLQDYTSKIEEAKRHVEIYKAKKQAQEHKTNILNLLAAGERKTGLEQTITPADLHSSDFESCESEREDWEEIQHKVSHEKTDKKLIPAKGLQITVAMPDVVRKKKGVDLMAAMKRRLNRIRKENQILVHRVHLLCWIAHGNYVNSAINDTETLGMALSLLPSEQCYPSDRIDLSYLEQITNWYKRTVNNIEKPVPVDMPLDKCLQDQINKKVAYNKKMLAIIFVAILRALGAQVRIVMSLQVEPLRPPASELHSLSVKESKSKKAARSTSKVSRFGKSSASTSQKVSSMTDVKIKVQKPTPEKDKKAKKDSKKTAISGHKAADSVASKSKSGIGTKKATGNIESKASRKTTSEKSQKKDVDIDGKLGLDVPKPSTKSTESVDSINSNSSLTGTNSKGSKEMSKSETKLKVNNPKPRKRAKSTDSIDSAQSSSSQKTGKSGKQKSKDSGRVLKNETKLKVDNSKPRERSKSTESIDSVKSSTRSQKGRKSEAQNTKDTLETPKPDGPKTRKRAKSTESIDSVQSNSSTRSTKNCKADKLTVSTTRKRTNSTKSEGSKSSVKSKTNRSKSAENVKSSKSRKPARGKVISQVDGLYDSDSDVEMVILQLDGANDVKSKSKPNLKTLKKPPASENGKTSTKKPNLKSLTNGKSNQKQTAKKKETSDSDSEFEPSSGSPLKKGLEKAAPDLKKLKTIKCQSTKQVDVTKDVVSLVKGRIAEQKQIDRRRLVQKRKPDPASGSDSDYVPEPMKKKHHDSEDDFVPRTKVKRRVQVHPVLSDNDTEKKKKKGNDVWVEVFLEAEEKWISVDIVYGHVHCIKEISQRATHPITYVLAWDNINNVKDVTQRYCPNFNTITRKLRVNQKWWNDTLKPFRGIPTARDKEEDDDLARQQMDQPLPKSIAEYKDHPLYVLRRHLLKFEAIYPPEPATLGFIRGEAVYPRGCVFTLHSREIWLKQAKVVKLGEQPYKIVKARPKWDKLSNQVITDQLVEIFGPWQVEDYDPPTAENGIVPRNAFGNVDLFKPCMLPKGCVHLKLPGLNRLAKRMNIDCAPAIIGFDFHSGWTHPVYDGFIVCKEFEDKLICAWDLEQDELDRKEQEKIDKRVYGNWKKLIRGLLIRERLRAKYDFGEPSTSTSKDKKAKGPTLCTKKK